MTLCSEGLDDCRKL